MDNHNNKILHKPVLLNESIRGLNIQKDSWYIDATAGLGGHTRAMLAKGARVCAIDKDEESIAYLQEIFRTQINEKKVCVKKGNFAHLDLHIRETKISKPKGVLLDLGMSTYQLKQSGRGFSFQKDEPLDMRMDKAQVITAADILNTFSKQELYVTINKFAEEELARELADAIFLARTIKPIITTKDLTKVVSQVKGKKGANFQRHPATRLFQALRIVVNNELENLKQVLPQALKVLSKRGRCVVISYHSLEDRIVKQFYKSASIENKLQIITKRPIKAGSNEIKTNPASRSAKLRIAEKI